VHRLENAGRIPLELIEVQSGAYLGEDDIVRFEDTYGRARPVPAIAEQR
jgi:mannose-6-phosphate isomerase-like protein (cupin superfamily)